MMTGVTEPLAGRVAIVTGASRGIGRATALALGARGVRLLVHFRSGATEAAEVVSRLEALGTAAICVEGDLADRDVPASLVEATLRAFGRLDIVVNNGGAMTDALLEELDDATWEEAIAVHLSSAFRLVRAAAPAMRRVGWGRIVSVSSQVVATGSSGHAHYAAAKSGLNGLTYSLAKELGPDGITVNLVVPGRILTDIITHRLAEREDDWLSQTPLRRFGQPEEVAAAIAFLVSDEAGYITGASLHVNGGLVMS
jgi:3-oxoacyl-[acyl-carrier protein] reductase